MYPAYTFCQLVWHSWRSKSLQMYPHDVDHELFTIMTNEDVEQSHTLYCLPYKHLHCLQHYLHRLQARCTQ